ncbi:MraY family glycosyltransferase [Pseudokineococcus marinus]|uniref:Undecaprenyl/decaprenyl-phosphate alpha-N-acetylglucosaminyl 1-phosphate transferase n=1 Tax=Pseudokineococcus marinus TaxID=351215 RepID=A0A849BH25_9ACTN|nr:MraY family glycosyltransferase [Pseudokineococcus marinus]NNH22420.1 undecaprenyl/decaprenyl-phosphate alpha-N-acetylglucosaminyl 1-phosphate transferase [Pseudokineococcus marinus]
MRAYLLVLVTAAAVTYLCTPLARRLAERLGAMSPVRDRDVHSVPTPRLGGTAMLAGLAAAVVLGSQLPFLDGVYAESRGPWAVLGAAALVSLLGVADDVWGLDALAKLGGQVLAASLLAWQGVQLLSLPVFGVTVGSGPTFFALTVVAVLVAVNAVNFIDGLDGLAAGVMLISGSAFFVYTYLLSQDASPEDYSNLATLVVAALVGCCLGFLPHNLHPARIFMGDSGSMLLGLLLAASGVAASGVDPTVVSRAQVVPVFLPILLPLAVLLLPLLDLVWAVVRRLAKGQSPFTPDRLHLHHRLLDLGHSHGRAVGVMYAWAAVISFGAVSTAFVPLPLALPAWGAAVVVVVVVTLRIRRRPPSPAAATLGSGGPGGW